MQFVARWISAAIIGGLAVFSFTVMKADAFQIDRVNGDDRYETAVEISQKGWSNGSDVVVLTRGDEFPDALAGSPLAHAKDAPLLLTEKDHLTAITKKEINRLNPSSIFILGGPGAVSSKIEKTLKNTFSAEITRIAGNNRYQTAAKVAAQLPGNDRAFVVNGSRFPDAMAAAPYAARHGHPILLTKSSYIPQSTQEALRGKKQTTIVGGDGVVSQSVENDLPNPERISGNTRYKTSAQAVLHLRMGRPDNAYVVTGNKFADGIAGSVLAAKYNDPILLVEENYVPNAIKIAVHKRGLEKFTVFGGYNAVDQYVDTELSLPIQLLLVNKARGIPASYKDDHLVKPNVRFPSNSDLPKHYMSSIAAGHLENMFDDAWAAGKELYAVSGYRSYERQKEIHERITRNHGSEYADRVSAEPGHSEHQTGLAMDVSSPAVGYQLVESFANTVEGRWLEQHASDYGFIIRYPDGRERDTGYTYEPWHLRYVGKSIARYMDRTNKILEDYLR
ncbi:cell wall-binding repeat-containing protein [Halobacillus salinarum]|uniref:Cell wall-binding repeat-containing protein n=1 Tax=Halobacillus salinarum TaxID=2932257 RepID=A0ABY4EJR1_9BACI|nr:cell wall-binding repeat-containing protein [Halobacillus salinarum]UOQ44404.1 cell wall-binding repeat-containing protein [Halobacillus salinarum]